MQYLMTSVITSLHQLQSRTLLYIITAEETSVIILFKADFAPLVFLISEYGKHTFFFFFFKAGNLLPLKKFTMLFRRPCCNCHLPTCHRSMEFVLDFSFE